MILLGNLSGRERAVNRAHVGHIGSWDPLSDCGQVIARGYDANIESRRSREEIPLIECYDGMCSAIGSRLKDHARGIGRTASAQEERGAAVQYRMTRQAPSTPALDRGKPAAIQRS
jgi:hypothetical protein